LFKSSAPGASPGASAATPAISPGRDPHITGCDMFWDDLEGGGHQRHKLRIVAPYRLRAETEIRQSGRLLDVVFEFPFGRVVDTAMACGRDGIVPPGLDLMTVHKEATALRSAYTERGQEGTRERVAIQAGGLAHIRLAFQEEAAVIIAKRR
jgi:hypothetical protein